MEGNEHFVTFLLCHECFTENLQVSEPSSHVGKFSAAVVTPPASSLPGGWGVVRVGMKYSSWTLELLYTGSELSLKPGPPQCHYGLLVRAGLMVVQEIRVLASI